MDRDFLFGQVVPTRKYRIAATIYPVTVSYNNGRTLKTWTFR